MNENERNTWCDEASKIFRGLLNKLRTMDNAEERTDFAQYLKTLVRDIGIDDDGLIARNIDLLT